MKLKEWLEKEGIKAQEFARRIGYSQSGISRIMHGEYVPSKPVVKRIEKETKGKVRPSDWYKDDDDEKKEGPAASVAPFLVMDNLVSVCG